MSDLDLLPTLSAFRKNLIQTEKGNLEKREYSEKKRINNSLREKRYYIHEKNIII